VRSLSSYLSHIWSTLLAIMHLLSRSWSHVCRSSLRAVRHSGFGFQSSFGLRHSSFPNRRLPDQPKQIAVQTPLEPPHNNQLGASRIVREWPDHWRSWRTGRSALPNSGLCSLVSEFSTILPLRAALRSRKLPCEGQICRLLATIGHKQSHYLSQTVLVRIVVVRRVPGLYAHLLAFTYAYNDPPQNDKSRCLFRAGTDFTPPN
jgi:hypothetical protein